MKEDTSKGNGSRGARYEYSLSDNVTWVQPLRFLGGRRGGGGGRSDGCSFPVYLEYCCCE